MEIAKSLLLPEIPRRLDLEVVLDWIHRVWQEISPNVIIKSFEGLALI
jgi:hypothetical protein